MIFSLKNRYQIDQRIQINRQHNLEEINQALSQLISKIAHIEIAQYIQIRSRYTAHENHQLSMEIRNCRNAAELIAQNRNLLERTENFPEHDITHTHTKARRNPGKFVARFFMAYGKFPVWKFQRFNEPAESITPLYPMYAFCTERVRIARYCVLCGACART